MDNRTAWERREAGDEHFMKCKLSELRGFVAQVGKELLSGQADLQALGVSMEPFGDVTFTVEVIDDREGVNGLNAIERQQVTEQPETTQTTTKAAEVATQETTQDGTDNATQTFGRGSDTVVTASA